MSLPPLLRDFPNSPVSVTVVFRGLLTFCFNSTPRCEVGVLNEFFTGQEHDLVFRKWIKAPVSPTDPALIYPKPKETFELRVNGAAPSADGVFIIGRNPFNRSGGVNHPNDFRWMIDFESDIYPSTTHPPIMKKKEKVSPRLTINKGVFYTHHRTVTKFNAHPSTGFGQIRPLESVAEVMAARIYLNAGGSVEVVIDGKTEDTLPQASNVEYQIDVFNLCDPTVHIACDYSPHHPTEKTRRNDFYMYYNAFQPGTVEEFLLMPVFPVQDSILTGICRRASEHGTDPAPCGPTGFGRSNGFE